MSAPTDSQITGAFAKALRAQGVSPKQISFESGTASVAPLPMGPRPVWRNRREWERLSRSVFGEEKGGAR